MREKCGCWTESTEYEERGGQDHETRHTLQIMWWTHSSGVLALHSAGICSHADVWNISCLFRPNNQNPDSSLTSQMAEKAEKSFLLGCWHQQHANCVSVKIHTSKVGRKGCVCTHSPFLHSHFLSAFIRKKPKTTQEESSQPVWYAAAVVFSSCPIINWFFQKDYEARISEWSH